MSVYVRVHVYTSMCACVRFSFAPGPDIHYDTTISYNHTFIHCHIKINPFKPYTKGNSLAHAIYVYTPS